MWTTTRSDRRHVASLLALSLALALAPALAHADEPADPPPAPSPAAPPKPLDSLRERFREGMDKYKAGAFGDAIVIWESIYRELGAGPGYRLAFDLARAYEELGEHIKAAEHYETYLERVAIRRREGELLEPQVAKQETDARERLDKIAAIKGRIHVKAIDRTVIVHIDNAPPHVAPVVVYVEPGDHTVTFGAGSSAADVRHVTVKRGELLDVDPPEATPPPAPPEPRFETRVDHPFSATVLWIGAGAAVASLVIPAITYANALSIKSDYDAPSSSRTDKQRLQTDYESARTNAYASIVIPALFTTAVGALTVWYVLGTKETRVPFTPQASVSPSGATVGVSARF